MGWHAPPDFIKHSSTSFLPPCLPASPLPPCLCPASLAPARCSAFSRLDLWLEQNNLLNELTEAPLTQMEGELTQEQRGVGGWVGGWIDSSVQTFPPNKIVGWGQGAGWARVSASCLPGRRR
jgi:hypothetical protein